jgi:hypothetical protein
VLIWIDSEILKNYRVTYSPNGFYFKADENGTKLEKGLEKTLAQSKREIRRNFNENIKKIELDYLRKLAELSSSTLEAYNKANDGLRNILIKNRCDGRLVVKFR